jgi:hypothetical protein
MESQYFITPHAAQQFLSRFNDAIKPFKNAKPLDFFKEAVKITVKAENRNWIDYHYNVRINAVFVSDRITKTIITTFIPKDEIKYAEAIFLKKAA